VTSIRESFILLKILGSGTFGNVILVKDKQTGLERAAKELIKGSFDTSQFPLFLQELMILKSLVIASQDHPSVMNFYEIIETSTRFYVITEYLSGGQLFERFSKSPVVNEKIAAKCLFDVIISLNYIHANGLNHKDIKPENLLFEFEAPDAHLKLVDYGFSLLKKTSSGIKGPVGSVTYMAPEKFKGEENDKSDVWSMGVILFIILSGRVPFQGKTDSETIQKILNKPLSMNSKAWETVSEPAKRLVSKMLDKNPENRPSSQEIMMDDWFMSYTKDSITSTAFHPDTVLSISKFHVNFK
jgi:calcium-dependent protein kinase